MKSIFFISILSLLHVSCVNGILTVKSTPEEADVKVVNGEGVSRNLGKTPLEINIETIFGPNDDSTRLMIQKPGMYRESVTIPRSALPSNHRIHVTLKELEKVEIEKIIGKECKDQEKSEPEYKCPSVEKSDFAKLAQGVATSQALIARKNYKGAEVQLNTLISQYPYVAVLYSLRGNTMYLSKDFNGAHSSYKRALELDPENIETRNILSRIQKFVSVKPVNDGE